MANILELFFFFCLLANVLSENILKLASVLFFMAEV